MGAEETTPPPIYQTGPLPRANPPSPMAVSEKMTYRKAAFLATRLHPGPIGELISRELLVHDEFGWVLGAGALLTRVRDQIMEQWREHEEAQAKATAQQP